MTLATEKSEAWLLQRAALGLDVDVSVLAHAIRKTDEYACLLSWFIGATESPGSGASQNDEDTQGEQKERMHTFQLLWWVQRNSDGLPDPFTVCIIGSSGASGFKEFGGGISNLFYCLRVQRGNRRALDVETIQQQVVCGNLCESTCFEDLSIALQQVYACALGEINFPTNEQHKGSRSHRLTISESSQHLAAVLDGAVHIASGLVTLKVCKEAELVLQMTRLEKLDAAKNTDLVSKFEMVLDEWCGVVRHVVLNSRAVNPDHDSLGLMSELEGWKSQAACFDAIIKQIDSELAQGLLSVLLLANSTALQQWRPLEDVVRSKCHEAKHITRYLYSLEGHLRALYAGDLGAVRSGLEGLMQATSLMVATCAKYSTQERLTVFFMKLSNQMILCCKTCLHRDGGVWALERPTLLRRLDECIQLNQDYRALFRAAWISPSHSRPVHLSDAAVFGKFDSFCARLSKLAAIFHTIEQFDKLRACKIENIDGLLGELASVVAILQDAEYDILDHRRDEFDSDYERFVRGISEVEMHVQEFIVASFARVSSPTNALTLLAQFQRVLDRDNLKLVLVQQYEVIADLYMMELDKVREAYEKHKSRPPVPRNMPPVAGNVAWARQLLRRIELPMAQFQAHPMILQLGNCKHILRTYNRVASALVEFEVLWLTAWSNAVAGIKPALHASVFVRHPETRRMHVNFDRAIPQMIHETKNLQRMRIKVPRDVEILAMQEDTLKKSYAQLTCALEEYHRLMKHGNAVYGQLIRCRLEAFSAALHPGLAAISWSSPNLARFIQDLSDASRQVGETVARLNDILENRINARIQKHIRHAHLTSFELSEALSPSQLCDKVASDCANNAACIDSHSQAVELAVHDMFILATQGYTTEQCRALEANVEEILRYFELRTFQALSDTVSACLCSLRAQMTGSDPEAAPLFLVRAEHCPSNLGISTVPSMADVERCVRAVGVRVLHSTRAFKRWGQDRNQPRAQLDSYHLRLTASRRVVKSVLLLVGAFAEMRDGLQTRLLAMIQSGCLDHPDDQPSSEPARSDDHHDVEDDVEERVGWCARQEAWAEALPDALRERCVQVDVRPVKAALLAAARARKLALAGRLSLRARSGVTDVSATLRTMNRRLHLRIQDLEDMRAVMVALAELRTVESDVELRIPLLQDDYNFLRRFKIPISVEELEEAEQLPYAWRKLKTHASAVVDHVSNIQHKFRLELQDSVKVLLKEVRQFKHLYDERGPKVAWIKVRTSLERQREFQRQLDDIDARVRKIRVGETLFHLPQTQFAELDVMRTELKYIYVLCNIYQELEAAIREWQDTLWYKVSFDMVLDSLSSFQQRCKQVPLPLRSIKAFLEMEQTIGALSQQIHIASLLKQPYVRTRHWVRIAAITRFEFAVSPMERDCFCLKHLLAIPLQEFINEIEEIASCAAKESSVEHKLEAIRGKWSFASFKFVRHSSKGGFMLDKNHTANLVAELEDARMVLAALQSNQFRYPFETDIVDWLRRLTITGDVIDQWMNLQGLWMYLEVVFTSGDIAKQLPQETKRFAQVHRTWSKMMASSAEHPDVLKLCVGDTTVHTLLPQLHRQLELCQSSLSGFLSIKRDLFPRFYFVSDRLLLEVIGHGRDPNHMQRHLNAMFDNVHELWVSESLQIQGMISGEGERIALCNAIVCDGNVETWLAKLEAEMKDAVRGKFHAVADSYLQEEMDLEQFLKNFPAQATQFGIAVQWTSQSEEAILTAREDRSSLPAMVKRAALVLTELVHLATRHLDRIERTKIETLVTMQIHQHDVSHKLQAARVRSCASFDWQRQMRCYWTTRLHCQVSVTDVDLHHSYEYLGCQERLVITPLSDRCYITLVQALGLFLGGAPTGPAGTGKTETTKDLGHSVGRFVVVFNCSEQFDHQGIGGILKGLCQSGAWGCFDEFNRIQVEVLSVVAQQVTSFFSALRTRESNFMFTDGTLVRLNNGVGIFITTNPNFAGRHKLPENLKALFRSVAMMAPDVRIIIRVRLAASGFQNSDALAKKLVALYELSEHMLSTQRHYDFGLRNILAVLRACGPARRSFPDQPESGIFMRVVREMNMAKLVKEDEPLFLSLLRDVFPGKLQERRSYPELERALSMHIAEAIDPPLSSSPAWLQKVIQLHETASARWGVVVLGSSRSGKSTCVAAYLGSLARLGTKTSTFRLNPKSVTAAHFMGAVNLVTHEWTDGIFSALWRKAWKQPENSWLLLDGPVDPTWIESLNTVLDDNRMLSLANGDRLPMRPSTKVVFEVENLNNASPATISRTGVVYVSNECLGWQPIVEAWLSSHSRSTAALLKQLFDVNTEMAFRFIKSCCSPMMNVEKIHQVVVCMKLLQALLPTADSHELDACTATVRPHRNIGGDPCLQAERIFAFSTAWALGGLLDIPDRNKFDVHLRTSTLSMPPQDLQGHSSNLGIFDFMISSDGEWSLWMDQLPSWEFPAFPFQFDALIVPNVELVQNRRLLSLLCQSQGSGALLIGASGSCKTVTMQHYMQLELQDISDAACRQLVKTIQFSFATTPSMFNATVESFLERRPGGVLGPLGGHGLSVFIDDINLPKTNQWGDQVTNEAVRYLIEDKTLYILRQPGKSRTVQGVRFLGAMRHPGGNSSDVPARLKGHFSLVNIPLPSDESIEHVFSHIMAGYMSSAFNSFSVEVVKAAQSLAYLCRELWQSVKRRLRPLPSKSHYNFNLRDLSRISQGILRATPEVIRTPELLHQLWLHESTRVLADRLNSQEDRQWFTTMALGLLETVVGSKGMLAAQQMGVLCFVDFVQTSNTEDDVLLVPRKYQPISDWDQLALRAQDLQEKYNKHHAYPLKLELVFFESALAHLARICRVLAVPRGHLMLVGGGSCGKQSLARLASFIVGYHSKRLQATHEPGAVSSVEALQAVCRQATTGKQPVCLIVKDNDLNDEELLEHISMLLTNGEVQSILPKDEIERLANQILPLRTTSSNEVESKDLAHVQDLAPEQAVVDRLRDNLHVLFIFSAIGSQFQTRLQQFPALVNACTMDWFFGWPTEALLSVAANSLKDFAIDCSNLAQRDSLVDYLSQVHNASQQACADCQKTYSWPVHTPPKAFLLFLEGYKSLYARKHREAQKTIEQTTAGLEKLAAAERTAASMSDELAQKEKRLSQSQLILEELIRKIDRSARIAEEQKLGVEMEQARLAANEALVAEEKCQAERDLDAAKPSLENAKRALKSIRAKDVITVKRMNNPPVLIKLIMDCVLILFRLPVDSPTMEQHPDGQLGLSPSWRCTMGFLMNDIMLLDRLTSFPKDEINAETCELLLPYLNMPEFTFESARRVSGNIAGLCVWVRSMVEYHEVAKHVVPKMERLRMVTQELHRAQNLLQLAEVELRQKDCEVLKLKEEYEAALDDKIKLEENIKSIGQNFQRANSLISGLKSERSRWAHEVSSCRDLGQFVMGDCAVASAFTAYCGPFNQQIRSGLLNRFVDELRRHHIPLTKHLSVQSFLASDIDIMEWHIQGLPKDEMSVQNAIIALSAECSRTFIDPQGQGTRWIKNKEASNMLVASTLNDELLLRHLESSLMCGLPLLIEDVDEKVDRRLRHVLKQSCGKRGCAVKVKLGCHEYDMLPGFHLYLSTKLANPHFSQEHFACSVVINFTVTFPSLEEQLLHNVLVIDKPELEELHRHLLQEISASTQMTKDMEESLLARLSAAKGNLLDDTSLTHALFETKSASQDVCKRMQAAVETQASIDQAREEYRPIATRGALLYFLVADMSLVNNMYHTSLSQLCCVFEQSIRAFSDIHVLDRVGKVVEEVTRSCQKFVVRGLYRKHHLLFGIMMALKMETASSIVNDQQMLVLVHGGGALNVDEHPNPLPWLPNNQWLNVVALGRLSEFRSLVSSITTSSCAAMWENWYESEAPEHESIGDLELTEMQRLLLVRCFRQDRIVFAASRYVSQVLGPEYLDTVSFDLASLVEKESSPAIPIMFLLSPGADPSSDIEALAKRKKQSVVSVSMGQGQETKARRLVQQSRQKGHWLILQNCHLSFDFMRELEVLLEDAVSPAVECRIWLTAEPEVNFPKRMLQMSIKLSNEPPSGLKASLLRSFQCMEHEVYSSASSARWPALLFSVYFLHSILKERCTYGPIGWSCPYEFNQSDLAASVQMLQKHFDSQDRTVLKGGGSTKLSALRFLLGEVIYGGHVMNIFDQRVINTYCSMYLHEDMHASAFSFAPPYASAAKACDKLSFEQVHNFIEALPQIDDPGIFGLNANVAAARSEAQGAELLAGIQAIQPTEVYQGQSLSREQVVSKLASELMKSMPVGFAEQDVRDAVWSRLGGPLPLNIFLLQETNRLRALLEITRRDLQAVQLVSEGASVAGGSLQKLMDDLYDARVPLAWSQASWSSPTLRTWANELSRRAAQLQQWTDQRRPISFRIAGFFNPKGFLAAVHQEIVHANRRWSVDSSVQVSSVTQHNAYNVTTPPEVGVYVHGLYLEGANWNAVDRTLCLPTPKAHCCEMPALHIFAIEEQECRKTKGYRGFTCPVFHDDGRAPGSCVFEVDLEMPLDTNPEFWMLKGTALFMA